MINRVINKIVLDIIVIGKIKWIGMLFVFYKLVGMKEGCELIW